MLLGIGTGIIPLHIATRLNWYHSVVHSNKRSSGGDDANPRFVEVPLASSA